MKKHEKKQCCLCCLSICLLKNLETLETSNWLQELERSLFRCDPPKIPPGVDRRRFGRITCLNVVNFCICLHTNQHHCKDVHQKKTRSSKNSWPTVFLVVIFDGEGEAFHHSSDWPLDRSGTWWFRGQNVWWNHFLGRHMMVAGSSFWHTLVETYADHGSVEKLPTAVAMGMGSELLYHSMWTWNPTNKHRVYSCLHPKSSLTRTMYLSYAATLGHVSSFFQFWWEDGPFPQNRMPLAANLTAWIYCKIPSATTCRWDFWNSTTLHRDLVGGEPKLISLGSCHSWFHKVLRTFFGCWSWMLPGIFMMNLHRCAKADVTDMFGRKCQAPKNTASKKTAMFLCSLYFVH